MLLKNIIESANTGLDAIQRAPIVLENTGLKCLRIQDISQSKDFDRWGNTIVSEENLKAFSLKKDDIIIARTGSTIGVNFFVPKNLKSVYNNGLIRLRVNTNKALPYFVYCYLQTKQYSHFIESISGSSATQPNMRINDLLELQIPDKTLSEQQHIVDTIGSIDDLIEKNDKIIELTKRYIHQIYRSFDFDSTEKTLQDEFNISIGRTPPTKEHQWFDNGNYKWLSIKDMKMDGDFCFETSQYLTNEAVEKFNIPVVNPGDVLLSFKLTVGRIAISNCNMVTNEAIACFKFNDESLRWYLYCYLNNCNFLNDADNTSSIGQAINSSIIKKYKFLKPSNEKLIKFNNIVEPLFNYVKTKREENIYLLQSKQNLLKKYFG